MESFLILMSIMSLGTISPIYSKSKPDLQIEKSIQRSIHLSKIYDTQVKKEITEAPAKILALCKQEIRLDYKDRAKNAAYYKCKGLDVVFFESNKHFYAAIESNSVEEGFATIPDQRLSKSLARQVSKMWRDTSERASAKNKLNNI